MLKAPIHQLVAARNEKIMCINMLKDNGWKINEIRLKDESKLSEHCDCVLRCPTYILIGKNSDQYRSKRKTLLDQLEKFLERKMSILSNKRFEWRISLIYHNFRQDKKHILLDWWMDGWSTRCWIENHKSHKKKKHIAYSFSKNNHSAIWLLIAKKEKLIL